MSDSNKPIGERMAQAEAQIAGFHKLFESIDARHQENSRRFDRVEGKIDANAVMASEEHNELRVKVDALQGTNDRQQGSLRIITWMIGILMAMLIALIGWGPAFWVSVFHLH